MKGTRKDRRSKRIPAVHRLLLTILGPTGSEISKEIVSTVELSQFGARVRGRRSLRADSEGVLTQLQSGRQARIRIAWQQRSEKDSEFLDTGLEVLSGFDYWGISFSDQPPQPAVQPDSQAAEPSALLALLEELKQTTASENGKAGNAGPAGGQRLENLWCGLIEQLEAKKILSRDELIAAVRGIADLQSTRNSKSARQ